jgi:CMP-N-acetylneuraminic acid synthetase
LIHYSVETAHQCAALDRVVVTTDDAEIDDYVTMMGAEVITRPEELARDDTPMIPVIQHTLMSLEEGGYQPGIITLLQPTAPLRRVEHIVDCLELMRTADTNSVVSVSIVPGHFHPDWQFTINENGELEAFSGQRLERLQTRRQDLHNTYTRNGAVYVVRTEAFLASESLLAPPCMGYIMAVEESVNIDAEEDIWIAERYLLQRRDDIDPNQQ